MGKDLKTGFEEHKKRINDSFPEPQAPLDAKGRILLVAVLALVLITVWFMIDIVIITFILTFVFYHLHKYAVRGLSKLPFKVPDTIVLVLVYVAVIGLFIMFLVENVTIIIDQLSGIATTFFQFDFATFIAELDETFVGLASLIDINGYIAQLGQLILTGLASLGTAIVNFIFALVMSFFFVLEKKKIVAIAHSMKSSRIALIYRYFALFAGSFSFTFGTVMKVQVLIATVNCVISIVYLSIAGFPYIFVLSIMIFFLGLIPVAGAIITFIPLTIVGFNIGGWEKVLEMFIMIMIFNIIEVYVLDPKLLSKGTALPVSLIFVVLIISQRYLGMWGMLIGVPFFIYVMNVLNIDYRSATYKEGSEGEGKKPRPGPFWRLVERIKLRYKKEE